MDYFIDADVLYAYLNPSDWLHEAADRIIGLIKTGKINAKTSIIVVLELAVVIKRDIGPEKVEEIMKTLKNLTIKFIYPLLYYVTKFLVY
ncbi:hypothetical protein HRbin01_01675 [archaeon HR01]|nr:hypothetical protein HRbin01_01675 [archaeon HR01]